IDSFLDEIHDSEPLFGSGWSLGGGGILRYNTQSNPKHKFSGVVAIAPANPGTGENLKVPTIIAHSSNDRTVSISNSENFVNKIPKSTYFSFIKGSSGDHWFYLDVAFGSPKVYDWFISLLPTTTPPPIEPEPTPIIDIEGKIYLRGNKVIAKFGDKEYEI